MFRLRQEGYFGICQNKHSSLTRSFFFFSLSFPFLLFVLEATGTTKDTTGKTNLLLFVTNQITDPTAERRAE
jgi:hypothetical protein